MKNFTFSFKSLLIAAGLMLGSANAWAQTTSWAMNSSGTYTGDMELSSNTAIVSVKLGSGTWGYDASYGVCESSNNTQPSMTNNIPTSGNYIVIKPTVDIAMTLDTRSSANHNFVLIEETNPTKEIINTRARYYVTYDLGTLASPLKAGKTYYAYSKGGAILGYRGFTAKTIETYTLHYVDNSATPVTIKSDVEYTGLYGSTVTASEEDMSGIEYNDKYYVYNNGNESIELGSGTNEITLVYVQATAATITVKYWNNEEPAVEIKDATTIETYVGATDISASGENLPTYITYNDVRYQYSSGNTPIAEVTGDATINLIYTEVPRYTCSVNAKAGDVLLTTEEESVYDGEDVTVYYQMGYAKDGKWYFIDKNGSTPGYGVAFNSVTSNQTANKTTYTLNEDVVYFAETEDLTLVGSWAANGAYLNWRSNGMAKRMAKNSYVYTSTITPGVYDVTLWARNQRSAGAGTETMPIFLRDEDGNMTDLGVSFPGWTRGGYEAAKTATITIPNDGKNYSVVINNNTEYTSNLEMDYLYITTKKNVAVTVTSAGWATLYTPCALDFSEVEGLTAYTATVDGETVTLTEVDDVPANTGVVLKGDEGDYNIPVIASSETAKGDLRGNATEETAYDAIANTTLYILVKNDEGDAQFFPTNAGSIEAGKAYLPVANSSAKALRVVVNGQASDVTAPAVVETEEPEILFNMAGVQVDKNFKGFVVNQKGEKRFNR